MKTDVLDVMLLHSCDLKTLKESDALAGLVKAREAGKIRFAGYSGDNEAAAYAAGLADVAVIETSINLVDQANIDLVLSRTIANNIGVIAKRPIANAAWKDLSDQPGMYQNYAKTYTERLMTMNLTPADVGLPADAWAELALRFTLTVPGVHSAIIGTTSPQNLQANVEAANKGPLPGEAIETIRKAFKSADPQGKWQGQT
jgi:aryl-alcohol dehydrogenase-like predicted oxidoreductase